MLIRVLCAKTKRAHQAAPERTPGQTVAHRRGAKDTIAPCPWPNQEVRGLEPKGTTMRRVYLAILAATFPALALAGPKTARTSAMADNPFMQPSTLPFELPPFDRIRDSDYLPAFHAGMREQLTEVARIAHNPQSATFDNTIVALERAGLLLQRVDTAFGRLNACNTNPQMQEIDTEMAPKLTAQQDAIHLDPALWARVEALYEKRATLQLDPESLQLLTRYHTEFVRAGARLTAAEQTRLRTLNTEISSLTTRFKHNVLKATTDGAVAVDNLQDLDGLSAGQIGAAAHAAAPRGLTGKWLITLQNTTNQPVLERLTNRALRERIYKASIARASDGATDNTAVIAQLVKLRAERATLLGYANHAAYQLEDESAGNPAAVRDMISQVAPAARVRARAEAADIQKLIDTQAQVSGTPSFTLQPWDWSFYAQQVRKARYDFDQALVAPYFELDHVLLDGVFYAAHQLYGLSFKERRDLPVYQPDVRVFEVFDADGKSLALFYADYFLRPNKSGGAWDDSFVDQSSLMGTRPVIVNVCNFTKPAAGQPALLSFDDVTTMFHEFGHALHGMFSNIKYPTLGSVPRDFVEFPSQFNEHWALEPAVFANYAKHYQTGQPMPPELVEKIKKSK